MIEESRNEVTLAKQSHEHKDKDEDPSAGSDRGLKKRKLSKYAEPTYMSGSSKGTKSQPKSSEKSVQSEEPVFEVADSDIDFSAFIMNGGDYPFDLSKPLPLITRGKRQRVPFEFFINNDLKYLQGGISTMTYMTSTTKTKVAQYDLPGIEDMAFLCLVRALQSNGEMSNSTKRILEVTHVSEGDFPRLWINDIEDMLLLVVQNRLNNLSGDDVADFVIALRMYTRVLVDPHGFEGYLKMVVEVPDSS
ncbi:hypothetical protein Tco_1008408 [Tanacetum coccineum]